MSRKESEGKSGMKKEKTLTLREMLVFSLLGTVMFLGKIVMEWAPNVHPLALLIVAYTSVYRTKALIPIYLFVFMEGLYAGFSLWWVPYLYLWVILWGAVMLLPQSMPNKVRVPVLMAVAGLHGLLYGTLYAPFQALAFGLSFRGMLAWIVSGLPWDCVHAAGNLVLSSLAVPLISLLKRLDFGIRA